MMKNKRLIVNQGGTRSGKTFGIMKLLIALALNNKFSISVTSISFPHLRKGAMRDFMTIMNDFEIYDPQSHTKTEHIYFFPSGSYIEFFSTDNHLKVRGPGRDIWFANEANLISFETFTQMAMRTKKNIFLDYNPADEFHWIYDQVLPRQDCEFIQSTYLDNPFLDINQIKDIEMMKEIDLNTWNVFGLGNRGSSQHLIYSSFQILNFDFPENGSAFGLDFGFNHPSALVEVNKIENDLFSREHLYESHLTTNDLILKIKPIVKNKPVYCDSSRPEIIQQMLTAGINAFKANKNVKEGIDFIKSHKQKIHQTSLNLIKEKRSYKWKLDKTEKTMDEPIKLFDDACDAERYAAMSFKKFNFVNKAKTYSKEKFEYKF